MFCLCQWTDLIRDFGSKGILYWQNTFVYCCRLLLGIAHERFGMSACGFLQLCRSLAFWRWWLYIFWICDNVLWIIYDFDSCNDIRGQICNGCLWCIQRTIVKTILYNWNVWMLDSFTDSGYLAIDWLEQIYVWINRNCLCTGYSKWWRHVQDVPDDFTGYLFYHTFMYHGILLLETYF